MSILALTITLVITLFYVFLDYYTLSVGEFLAEYDAQALLLTNAAVIASWTYTTDISEEHLRQDAAADAVASAFYADSYGTAQRFLDEGGNLTYDQRRMLSKVGEASLQGVERDQLTTVMANMSAVYDLAQVCVQDMECMNLEPDLQNLMESSKNFSLLTEVWTKWRDAVGRKIRPNVAALVTLKNKKAQLNGYADYGAQLRGKYESDGFEEEIARLNAQMRPLYTLVHAYVRTRLQDVYGDQVIPTGGLMPANVFGDIWGRFWTELFPTITPYPDVPSVDATPGLRAKNTTVRGMYEMADHFYQSMGLKPLPARFYEDSMLERPRDPDRKVSCHGTAWDFMDGKDFRIRMCTEVNFKDLEVVHHELGHVQYFMQYAHQPYVYRDGANDGFHEAVGEMMGMTMSTVSHLTSLGLLPQEPLSKENTINFLLRTALKTVVTLPFHYVNDLWRWQVFRGEVPEDRWNKHYWDLKRQHLGVRPPTERTEEDLDIFNIFHVTHDFDMIRYFTRTILQFQFAETLCDVSGYEGPLHDCDFSGSAAAGDKLSAMLSLGSSLPWEDALEQLTGERSMDAKPILRYFAPLQEWLEEYLAEHGEQAGWGA